MSDKTRSTTCTVCTSKHVRLVSGAQEGEQYHVIVTDEAVQIREPGRRDSFMVPWGRIHLLGAQIKADRDRADAGKKPKITRGLMTTRGGTWVK